eukprot:Selendium_serpulae@DN4507_c0_g1_i2.p1
MRPPTRARGVVRAVLFVGFAFLLVSRASGASSPSSPARVARRPVGQMTSLLLFRGLARLADAPPRRVVRALEPKQSLAFLNKNSATLSPAASLQTRHHTAAAATPNAQPAANPRVWLDVAVGVATPQRVTLELYRDVVPKTAENFR